MPSSDAIAPRTLGQRMADTITAVIGTWTFIIIQTIIIIGWTSYNLLMGKSGFDPYPFILLNLFFILPGGLYRAGDYDEPEKGGGSGSLSSGNRR